MGSVEFRSPTAPGLVQRLARHNTAVLGTALVDAGMADLAPGQALLLPPLARGRRASEISRSLGVSRQAIAQAIAALEAAGYVARGVDPSDRRSKLVTLTDRGRGAVTLIREVGLREQRRWEEVLGAARLAGLHDALTALVDGLD